MCKTDLERLRDILHDLLPKYYVKRLITSVEHIPPLPCRIVVLQVRRERERNKDSE